MAIGIQSSILAFMRVGDLLFGGETDFVERALEEEELEDLSSSFGVAGRNVEEELRVDKGRLLPLCDETALVGIEGMDVGIFGATVGIDVVVIAGAGAGGAVAGALVAGAAASVLMVAPGLLGPLSLSRMGASCCCTAGLRSLHSLFTGSTPTVRTVSTRTCSARCRTSPCLSCKHASSGLMSVVRSVVAFGLKAGKCFINHCNTYTPSISTNRTERRNRGNILPFVLTTNPVS
jgi:hypothetical protein